MSLNRLPDSQAWLPFSYLLSEKHDALPIPQIRKLTVPGPFYSSPKSALGQLLL